jgi:hypothetical protein
MSILNRVHIFEHDHLVGERLTWAENNGALSGILSCDVSAAEWSDKENSEVQFMADVFKSVQSHIKMDELVSDEIGIVHPTPAAWLCLAHSSYIRMFVRSSCTGTLQLYRDASAGQVPQAAKWAQCTHIDIHFFSGRQKTSSSISNFGQILIAGLACD